jgi:hypothetical protein
MQLQGRFLKIRPWTRASTLTGLLTTRQQINNNQVALNLTSSRMPSKYTVTGGWTTGVRLSVRQYFPLREQCDTGSVSNTASYPIGNGLLSSGENRSDGKRHEANHSLPSSANGKTVWSCSPTSVWCGAWLSIRANYTSV